MDYKKIIKIHNKTFWVTIVVVIIIMFMLRKDLVVSSYSRIIIVQGFIHQDNKVYAKLFIKLSKENRCNILAKYANNSINRSFKLNKTNTIKYYLPDMPIGNTKVYFRMRCR